MQSERINQYLYILCFVAAVATSVFIFPAGIVGVGILVAGTFIVFTLLKNDEDKDFLCRLFLIALLCRAIFAALIFYFNVYGYFGGDANTYDYNGSGLLRIFWGGYDDSYSVQAALKMRGPGWGMNWFVAFLYFFFGRNIFATMAVECVVGAATAILIYYVVIEIFNNSRVARLAAYLVALFPAMIVWSAQALKDGLIVFLLVLTMLCVIRLQKRYSFLYTALLIFSLFGILSLRFYIFYIAAIAVTGSFLIGTSDKLQETVRRLAVFVIVGAALAYVGALRTASTDLEQYGSLEAVQRSRLDLARSADSGYGQELDVSTTEGAVVALPIGFTYLMLAPFPWQIGSLRQALATPESIVWWCLIPFLCIGLWYTIRMRWREAMPILIFTAMLTIAYSVFQANVGTAYRQRTQIQVFLFIFIAVGLVITRERRENKKISSTSYR